jgi:hypothetical protein
MGDGDEFLGAMHARRNIENPRDPQGVTFIFIANRELIAILDGLRYLDGGPCVHAVQPAQVCDGRPSTV